MNITPTVEAHGLTVTHVNKRFAGINGWDVIEETRQGTGRNPAIKCVYVMRFRGTPVHELPAPSQALLALASNYDKRALEPKLAPRTRAEGWKPTLKQEMLHDCTQAR